MGIPLRLLVAAVILAAVHLGIHFMMSEAGAMPETPVLERDVSELPDHLGKWIGEDVATDPRIFARSEAACIVDRQYRDPPGNSIIVHVSAYPRIDLELPHRPEECYQANGYRIEAEKDMTLEVGDRPAVTARLLTMERDGNWLYVLYWWQFGDRTVCTRDAMRKAAWETPRDKPWPPTVKVMLQASATSGQAAEERLRSIAEPILAWVREYR